MFDKANSVQDFYSKKAAEASTKTGLPRWTEAADSRRRAEAADGPSPSERVRGYNNLVKALPEQETNKQAHIDGNKVKQANRKLNNTYKLTKLILDKQACRGAPDRAVRRHASRARAGAGPRLRPRPGREQVLPAVPRREPPEVCRRGLRGRGRGGSEVAVQEPKQNNTAK